VLFIAGVGPQMGAATARVAAREGAKVAQLTLPSMLERRSGAFVFNSSAAALVAGQVRFGYQVVKAGLNALTRFMASRYGRQGIRANATLPFVVGGEVGKVAGSQNCIGRSGTAAETGEAVVFLLSDKASVITGQMVHLDGGLFSRAAWPTNAAPYEPPPPLAT
jgi:NAD(P)-dependent dehydrogenase (short-subunit alcohol dehydrogenase family)